MVGIRKDTVTGQQNALCRGAVDPMKDTAASEMAADLMQDYASGDLPSSTPKFDHWIPAAQPLSVGFRHQHRGISESTGPFHLDTEHMRMAGRDRQDRPECEYPGAGLVIQIPDGIPNAPAQNPNRFRNYLLKS